MIARGLVDGGACRCRLRLCVDCARTGVSQNAFYMVGDNAPLVRTNAAPGSTESEGEFSVVKRVYWFFAGR